MDSGVINPRLVPGFGNDNKGKDPIVLAPTFEGVEYTDKMAYLKFNNAIERMSQPREVEHTEVDVEFVVRNEFGSLYAVVFHYSDGSVETDMLTKMKAGGWWFYRYNTRFHPNFVSAYVSSVWGYKKPTELQIAQDLAAVPAYRSKMVFAGNYVLTLFPGGFVISRYTAKDDTLTSLESIDFMPFESLDQERIKDFYYNDVIPFFVEQKEFDVGHFSEDLILNVLESSLARLKKKYGDKDKFKLDKEVSFKFTQNER